VQEDADRLFYLGIGPIAAILLGVGLVPFRGLTVASNFGFAFVGLTILAGELGGRGAALATAVASALSLDFFLTSPYLHLAIHDKDDVIAFVGLAACGLLAAALGSPRRERLLAGRRLGLLQAALLEGASAGPVDSGLQPLVDAARGAFPLAAIVVRDSGGRLLARAGSAGDPATAPAAIASAAAFAPTTEHGEWREGDPVPATGVRLPLVAAARQVGWVDLWGDGRPAGNDARRSLAALVAAVSMVIDARGRAATTAARTPPASPSWSVGSVRQASRDHDRDR
jgi:hypothetical protein